MSCWVAPTLAAEIWQIPLDLLMSRIASGEIPVRDEDGFLFVDVAPYGPRVERPNRAPQDRPATFTAVASDVIHATDDHAGEFHDSKDDDDDEEDDGDSPLMVSDEEAMALLTFPTPPAAASDDDEMGPEDDTASKTLGDWRAARRKVGRTRVPPPRPRRLSA